MLVSVVILNGTETVMPAVPDGTNRVEYQLAAGMAVCSVAAGDVAVTVRRTEPVTSAGVVVLRGRVMAAEPVKPAPVMPMVAWVG